MYYYIQGELVLTEPNLAVIDAGGIGYRINISGTTLGRLAALKHGEKARLYTYLSVKEDAMELYGFYTTEELAVFKMLISVSGVGAKSAIAVLTLLSPEKFALAVASSDTKAIAKTSGIGPKTAARIVLELKDKIAKEISVSNDISDDFSVSETVISGGVAEEAQKALMVLGYTRSEAAYGLHGVDMSLGLEAVIKEALKKLMKN